MSDVANAAAPSAPAAPATATVTAPPAANAAPAAPAATTVAPGVTINVQPAPTAASPASSPAAASAVAPTTQEQEAAMSRIVQERLDRDRKARLKEFGAESDDEVKAAVAAHRARVEADKSAEAKAIEANAKLAAAQTERAELLASVAAIADTELARVTPAQREAVVRIAGDDPKKRLDTLRALAPTWAPAPPPANSRLIYFSHQHHEKVLHLHQSQLQHPNHRRSQ
jgi:hypothetical protein